MTTARPDDLLLSIDCGTQSTRALLFDPRGELVAKAQVALDDYLVERPGWMSHDVEGFWAASSGRSTHSRRQARAQAAQKPSASCDIQPGRSTR